ncbi:MAG: PAS domain S-box protein [Desulfobacterales bacterium]
MKKTRSSQKRSAGCRRTRQALFNPASVVASCDDAIIGTTLDGFIENWNTGAEKLFGYYAADVIGKNVSILVPQERKNDFEELLEKIRRGDHAAHGETVWVRKDDQRVYVCLAVSPVKNAAGAIVGVSAIARDMAAHRSEEEMNQESNRFALSVLDALTDHIAVLDENGTILAVNKAWRVFAAANHPDHRKACEKADYLAVCDVAEGEGRPQAIAFAKGVRAVMAFEQRVFCMEYPCHSPSEQRWFSARVTRFNGQGPMRIVVSHQNITKRKLAEIALQESEEKFRSLFEHSYDAILLTCPDGAILEANPAACEMFGRTLEEIRNVGRSGLVDIADSRVHSALSERAFKGRARAEITMLRADGGRFPADITSTIFLDASGRLKTSMIIRDISERRQYEELLEKKDTLFKKLSSHVPGMIYQFMRRPDGAFCFPFASEAIQDVFGCSPQDVLDDFTPIARVIVPEDLDRFIESVESSARSMAFWECEYRVQIPGRPIRWMVGRSTPEKLPDGSIVWHGFNADITEHKELESKLIQAWESYRNFVENAMMGIRIVNSDGKTLYANRALLDIFGFESAEELNATSVEKCYTPDSLEARRIRREKRRKGENAPSEYEISIVRKDGAVRHLEVFRKEIVWDGERHFQALYRDITQPKKVADELRRISRIQSLILDNSAVGICLVRNRIFEWVNPRIPEMLGLPLERVQGSSTRIFYSSATEYEEKGSRAYLALRKGAWFDFEVVMPRADGTFFTGRIRGKALQPKLPQEGSIWIFEDITDQKKAEELIEASLREKDILLKEIHHRVKNNLQVISSLLRMQARAVNEDRLKENCRASENRIRSMALVHEILYRSRNLVRVDFGAYVHALVRELYRAYHIGAGKIRCRLTVENVALEIDQAVPCGLIIGELVGNCLKYAFPNGKQGEIRIGLRKTEAGEFELKVRDNGVGFPKNFDPTQTLSLGLNLVKMLTEYQLKGRLEFVSTTRGAEFKITFRGK